MFWLINLMLTRNSLERSVNTTSFRTVLMNLLIISMMKKVITSFAIDVEITSYGMRMNTNVLNVRKPSLDACNAWVRNAIFVKIMENSQLI